MVTYLDDFELKLAELLKKQCDDKGKEIDPQESAKVLHNMGIIYKERTPDLISLIKSVALLNAAIARKPKNVLEIQADLRYVCGHVLRVVDAKTQDTDLVSKAFEIKRAFGEMRQKVNKAIQNIKKIPEKIEVDKLLELEREKVTYIREVQTGITSDYKLIMANVSDYCIHVMGTAPCKFAHVGMGSMARLEITPYSDYENIIVLEEGCQNKKDTFYSKVLPFFRHYAVIFQIILINLQETILPSVNITSLNDSITNGGNWFFDAFTPRGICFDGMMPHACKSPLGRQQPTDSKPWTTELIKPVSEMLKYLETEEDLKNGYHLADILTKTCFVYGDKAVYSQFSKGIDKTLNACDETIIRDQIRKQIKDDVESFSTKSSLSKSHNHETFNFKRTVYRSSTLFIAALGRLHNVLSNSCFEILQSLKEKGILSDYAKGKLEYCLALACEIRLRFYMQSKGQNDWIEKRFDAENKTSSLITIVGQPSSISYFQIAYSLQLHICLMLNIKKTHLYSDLRFVNAEIYEFLGLTEKALMLLFKCKNSVCSNSQFRDFDACLQALENLNETEKFSREKEKEVVKYQDQTNLLYEICNSLHARHKYNEAFEFGMKYLKITSEGYVEKTSLRMRGKIQFITGDSLYRMHNNQKAIGFLKDSIAVDEKLSENEDLNPNLAYTNRILGFCLRKESEYTEAIIVFEKSLEIYRRISSDETADRNLAKVLYNIGFCLKRVGCTQEADRYLEKSLEIYHEIFLKTKTDKEVAKTNENIALALNEIGQYSKAKMNLERSLNIYKRISSDQETDRDVARTRHRIGTCLKDTGQNSEAKTYFERSLKTYQKISSDEDTDANVAKMLRNIALCLKEKHRYKQAKSYLDKSLNVYQRISSNEDTDRNIADLFRYIGLCMEKTHRHQAVKLCYEKALKIYQATSTNEDTDKDVAQALKNLGLLLKRSGHHHKALAYLQKSLKIYERLSANTNTDTNVAELLHSIGLCLYDTGNEKEAKHFLESSQKIKDRI